MKKTTVLLLVGSLCLGGLALAPNAAAHDCTTEEGEPMQSSCETECKDGEDHNHRVNHEHDDPWNPFDEPYNHIHYDCSSSAPKDEEEEEEQPRCSTPRIVGICLISEDSAQNALNRATGAAGMAVSLVGGLLSMVDPDVECPMGKTPDPDSIEMKPGDTPETPTVC